MNPFVSVIGTIFIDCKGFARQLYNPTGRNLGMIEFFHGGVGRNVAENLANLQVKTSFISTVDRSGIGTEVRTRLDEAGVNLDYLMNTDKYGMGMWLAVLDNKGDLAGSISQMPDLDQLQDLISAKGLEIVKHSSHIVLELDLNSNITRTIISLAKEKNVPVYGIPGNLDVILQNRDILSDLECFICNDIEAGRLLNIDFGALDIPSMKSALKEFVLESSMKSMVITLGSIGSIYYDSSIDETGYQPVFPVDLVDSTGAGDAFFSGTVMGLINNLPLKEAVIYGTRVAGWTISSSENTCRDLYERMKSEGLL